jgi:ferritin-like metal-binding protein YciE
MHIVTWEILFVRTTPGTRKVDPIEGLTMFDKLKNQRELFGHKLGSALTMEQDVLDMLGNLEEEAQRSELKQQLRHHAGETRQQIDNIEQVFRALGEEPDDSPCLVTKALDKQAKADIKMADNELVDAVILSGAAETEHHEIAVYEALIAQAEHFAKPDVVRLLQQNLEMEQHTLEEVKQAQQRQLAGATA